MEPVRASPVAQHFRLEVGRAATESLRLQERSLLRQPRHARYRLEVITGLDRIPRASVSKKQLYQSIYRGSSSAPTCRTERLLRLSDVRADTKLASQADRRMCRGYPPAYRDIALHRAERSDGPEKCAQA